ncbi:TPA: hypothetical protein N0F65_001736, partial [Lagenidium giganteum]
LASKAVQRATLPLQRVHHVHCCHRLATRVLRVGHRVTDHVFQKHLQHATRFLVDQSADTLHTATTSQTTNGWFGDALDVVTEHLSVALGAALAESLATFATSRHLVVVAVVVGGVASSLLCELLEWMNPSGPLLVDWIVSQTSAPLISTLLQSQGHFHVALSCALSRPWAPTRHTWLIRIHAPCVAIAWSR